MVITKKMKEDILPNLPKGYASIVSEQCECSENTVYRVLHHGQSNQSVIEAIIALARDTYEKRRSLEQTTMQLSSKADDSIQKKSA